MSRNERIASASLTGVAQAYAQDHRLDWQQAMQEVQDALARYRIPAERLAEVLSNAAAQYVHPEANTSHYAGEAYRLLIESGADPHQVEQMHTERLAHRPIRFGDAQWGG